MRPPGFLGTESIEAYEYFLRGGELWRRLTREANAQAQVMLRRAVELDPRFASAYALLVQVRIQEHSNRWGDPDDRPTGRPCRLRPSVHRHAARRVGRLHRRSG